MKKILWEMIMFLGMTAALVMGAHAAGAQETAVSPALYHLAAKTEMHVAGLCGEEVSFDGQSFARAMNLSATESVVITRLPSSAEGRLFVGSAPVSEGQVLTGTNIARLTYAQTGTGESTGRFSVSVNGAPYSITCQVHMLKEVNYSPTVAAVPSVALSLQTYTGINAYGVMRAYDPEGDRLTYEIAEYPVHGTLEITDAHTGAYVYKPQSGYTGNDSFRYIAYDPYGNYSAGATVCVRVEEKRAKATFSDMQNHPAQVAAIHLTGAGIMSGMQVGNGYYFYPEKTITRAEFLVTAMKAIGMQCADVKNTGYSDDADIPQAMKGYISAAYEEGYFKGFVQDGKLCFCPNQPISRSEAAVVLSNMIGYAKLCVSETFADSDSIPAWANEAFDSLHSLGILYSRDGKLTPNAQLTRADAALLLSKTRQVIGR